MRRRPFAIIAIAALAIAAFWAITSGAAIGMWRLLTYDPYKYEYVCNEVRKEICITVARYGPPAWSSRSITTYIFPGKNKYTEKNLPENYIMISNESFRNAIWIGENTLEIDADIGVDDYVGSIPFEIKLVRK